jgi:hypothetical protein
MSAAPVVVRRPRVLWGLVAMVLGVTSLAPAPLGQPGRAPNGIWIDRDELQSRPTSGAAWTRLLNEASKECSPTALARERDTANTCVLAKALVFARTGEIKARLGVVDASWRVATAEPYHGSAVPLARQLAAYVIAADLVQLREYDDALDARFRGTISRLLLAPTSNGPTNLIDCHERLSDERGTQCGASRAAVAAYLGDRASLTRTAGVLNRWLDSALTLKPGDIARALPGAFVQAVLLQRTGYDVFAWHDRALLRMFTWTQERPGTESAWLAHLVNFHYRANFPSQIPPEPGLIDWTDWSHGTADVRRSFPTMTSSSRLGPNSVLMAPNVGESPRQEPRDPPDPTPRRSASARGIWIGRDELAARPTSGDAWERLFLVAGAPIARVPHADIADMNSKHDAYALATALVCARTGTACAAGRQAVLEAIGTERDARWLAVGRNLTAYVIAADLLGLRADGDPASDGTRVETWMREWLTRSLRDNNRSSLRQFRPFGSGSNADAQEGAAYAAVAAYLGDRPALDRAWDAFRTYACDPTAPDRERIDLRMGVAYGWAHDDGKPCAVNPIGAIKMIPEGQPGAGSTRRIDGAIINDMRRGGRYQWPPGFTAYPWTGLAGFVPAAVILQRAGYPAFEVGDRAVLRTIEYLSFLKTETGNRVWFDGVRGGEVVQLVNYYYGTAYPVSRPVPIGHTLAFTDWTHPTRAN